MTVLEDGFRYDGKESRSQTAIARVATGYPAISAPAWLGLTKQKGATPKPTNAKRKTDAPKQSAPETAPAGETPAA